MQVCIGFLQMNAFGVVGFNRKVHRCLRKIRRVLLQINNQNKEVFCFNDNAELNGWIKGIFLKFFVPWCLCGIKNSSFLRGIIPKCFLCEIL
jgi:hypothetical protein